MKFDVRSDVFGYGWLDLNSFELRLLEETAFGLKPQLTAISVQGAEGVNM